VQASLIVIHPIKPVPECQTMRSKIIAGKRRQTSKRVKKGWVLSAAVIEMEILFAFIPAFLQTQDGL